MVLIHLSSERERNSLLAEARKILDKGAIVKSKPEFGDYISEVFTRYKKDNTKRFMPNLKNLNQSVKHKHFKMEKTEK